MIVIIERDEAKPVDYGTVVVFTGFDVEGNCEVTFAVDHRPAQGLVDALEHQGEIHVEVEAWQVLS